MDFENALAQVAEQYRAEGYRVLVHPGAGDLPPFAEGHNVDLVAQNDDEKVLVQVKARRGDLRDAPDALQLAERVSSQPGWRFDVVVLNLGGPAYTVVPEAAEPPAETIEQSLAHAERMSRAGELQVSCVLSWAALEAAMRHAARAAGIEVTNAASPYLLRALYAEGLLQREEFDHLNDTMKIRNALVHGMVVPTIDPAVPRQVVSVARKLLSEDGAKPAA
jgi:Holliday junction resolvase-like predicted endonuclease